MIYYNEYGEDKPVKITEEEAIRRQRESGRRNNYEYRNDEEALYDFIVVYWAWSEKDA